MGHPKARWHELVEGTLNREMARVMQSLHVAFRSMDTVGAGLLQPQQSTSVCEHAGIDFGPGFDQYVCESSVDAHLTFAELKHVIVSYYMQHQGSSSQRHWRGSPRL